MTMCADGLAKLIEECGELIQVAGKRLAYFDTLHHPDGSNLEQRLEEEMADVMAAIRFVSIHHGLSLATIAERADGKLDVFEAWHGRPDNNEHGVQTP